MVTKKSDKPARHGSKTTSDAKKSTRDFWRELAKIGEGVPDSEWAKLPRDLAKNFDHYAHGYPKQDPRW